MSTKKTKKEFRESFDGFGGLDVSSPIGSGKLITFRNFKLLPDGSAIKRGGFRYICRFAATIRGEKVYSDNGEEVILVAAGRSLFRVPVTSDEPVTSSYIFESAVGSVKFFEYKSELYIIEGCTLYRYTGGCNLEKCIPYIPLYGYHWLNTGGTVNEPFNMLTPKIRIKYFINDTTVNSLNVGLKIKSIDAIYGNGAMVSPSAYKIDSTGQKILFSEYYFNKYVTVYLTVDTEEYRDADFESCDRNSVFDAFDDSRVFMYGGDDGSRVYCSKVIADEEVTDCELGYGAIVPLYFPKAEPVRFSGANSITDIKRLYDRVLVFSEYRTWVSSPLRTDEGRAMYGLMLDTATDTLGCPSCGAVTVIDGDNHVTLSHGGVYKWSIDNEFEEKMRHSLLSKSVNELFDAEFVRNALVCRNRGENEIWFANRASENGCVLVYNCGSGAWYMYDGINADSLLEIGETVAFRLDGSYYIFDGEEGYDCFESSERNIEAVVESAGFDFSCPYAKKHVDIGQVICELDGGEAVLELNDGDVLFSCVLDENGSSKIHGNVDFFNIRMRTSRTERVSFKLTAAGKSRQRIYRVTFFAS